MSDRKLIAFGRKSGNGFSCRQMDATAEDLKVRKKEERYGKSQCSNR